MEATDTLKFYISVSVAHLLMDGKLRDEVLNREVFYNLKEAKVIIEKWRQEYNTVRPNSSLDYRPPAPEAIMPLHFDPFWLSSSQEHIAQILT